MSRVLAILGIMSAIGLGSCVSGMRTDDGGLAWSFQQNEGEGPKLAYGAPASDHVVLMMTCEPGAPTATVSLLGGSPQGALVLASGREQARFDGRPVPSPAAGQLIEADARLTAAPLQRFRKTGDLTLIDRGRSVDVHARGPEKADVGRFFAACSA